MNPFNRSARVKSILLLWCLVLGVLLCMPAIPGLASMAQAQDEAPPQDEMAPKKESKSKGLFEIIRHLFESVGWFFGIVLGLVSVALVTLCVLLLMELRMDVAIPPAFVDEFTETVNKRRFKEAFEMAREDPSAVARVLSAGMSRLQYGIEDAREACYNQLESVKVGKEQLITYLATIGTLGPLLGLVGTVFGMILAFMTLASGDSIDGKALAGEISHALVVTLLGVGLSVPAITAHAFFKNRLTRITHDTGTVADDLLTQMYYNSKKAATASTPEMPPPQPAMAGAPVPPPMPAVRPK
ncbi:MAG: MotA/TolQ/ExbB proton channel family protein [Gemmataceae bacterium]